MSTPATKKLTAAEFIDWAMAQPKGRYELFAGEVIAMAPEKADHARLKAAAWSALKSAIKRAGVACEAFVDGLSVRINDTTVYEPDAIVNCGPRISGDDVVAPNPTIVVEVLSPSTQHIDKSHMLIDYFSLPAVHHYVLVDHACRAVIHHRRTAESTVATTIHRQGEIALDPPGLTVVTAELLDLG